MHAYGCRTVGKKELKNVPDAMRKSGRSLQRKSQQYFDEMDFPKSKDIKRDNKKKKKSINSLSSPVRLPSISALQCSRTFKRIRIPTLGANNKNWKKFVRGRARHTFSMAEYSGARRENKMNVLC